ncbi:MAG: hypothetical protein ACJ8AJ_06300, partial [Gemmatimonadaceae bacterium]
LIALSSVSRSEHERWQQAAAREGDRYGVDREYTQARFAGEDAQAGGRRRTWIDWLVVSIAMAVIVGFALLARPPEIALHWGWALALVVVTIGMLTAIAAVLWRTTRFN